MSPEIIDILSLLLKMAVTAAFVVMASLVTERAGVLIGSLISTLPIAAGPAYVFLSLEHDRAFLAESALATCAVNAATTIFALTYVRLAQNRGQAASILGALAIWFVLAAGISAIQFSFLTTLVVNAATLALCIGLTRNYRSAKVPLITGRWYDVPLRATMVTCLVAIVVGASNHVGPFLSGVIATFPIVLTSLILILHPRIGGGATAAMMANALWGLIGFGLAAASIHLTVIPLGPALSLSLALGVSIAWNLMIWQVRRWQTTQ